MPENTRSRLESDLEHLRSTNTQELSEVSNLKTRISSLEAANRDTLALLESKTTAYDKLSQDLTAQHQKAAELRKQISSLEQSVQSANSSVSSSKFREQSLQQEIDLLKKNNEWLENERKIKADEHTNFRKEKNARISELSRSNEQYISEAEALKRSESALKHRLEEQLSKYEDSVQEAQKLREEKIAEADAFRVELESVNRLADLQKASADTAKQRVQELSLALDETREEAADEIGRIRAEIETEHADREAAEQRVAELESRIEELNNELDQSRLRPSTPQHPMNGTGVSTPIRPGTPLGIFSPSSASRLKGSLSTTQLYSEYKKLEKDYANEKRANEQLQNNIDSMLEDLEASKPEIDELRADHSRIQGELMEMSSIVDKANQDRDAAIREMRSCQGLLEGKIKEVEVLSQQLRDAGAEIRYLLIEQHVRESGETLTREAFEELQRNADEAMRKETENLSETQRVVNEQLIVFKSIAELQQQNENQLKTIRNLVSNLESNESREKEQENITMRQELETAKAQIQSYQDEIRTMVSQSKSFVKERDMFRNMLTRRGHQVEPTDFSRSLPIPAGGSPARPLDGSVADGGESDYAKLLKDLQHHFDLYRQEATTDHSALKTQVDDLTKRNTQLQTEASRATGQLTAANQRFEMLQANFNMLKSENAEIQKRSYTAMENAAKQELQTQHVAEELVQAKGMFESMQRESANLKAEKDLWKSVEKRLIDDNESLRNERSRLDQLNGSLQNLLKEREEADSATRRRLQENVETLESELQTVKRKLNEEMEESKKVSLRRDYDHEQSQKRIDDLVSSLGNTREELAAAKASRDHLQARVDELTVELRSAEERLEVLTRPPPVADNEQTTNEETTLTKEQELAVEVSELKRDLDLKVSELERVNEQIDVYKNISQTSEERLQELIETNDQYREETDASLAEKDTKIKHLEERIEDISSELNTTNAELSQLRDEQSDAGRKLDEQRSTLEAEIERLKEQDAKNLEQAQFNLEASKVQAQIATEAQQNYENELVRHAEAAKTVQTVRAEANELRLELANYKSQAQTAKTDLEQKEASWTELKDRYERELSDLKTRREEVLKQNNLLHGQLESVTQQITALQRDRAALAGDDVGESPAPGIDNLQEVINYLRREKEIVDVQYHLSTQEAKRLRQQLDFTQAQLDETRLKLDQQRRAEVDSERNAMSHNKLMETLNELNLFRESSVTLRAEAKQATQSLIEKSRRVEELESQILEAQGRIAELENLGELREGQMKLLRDDRDHWRQRTENILSKYDRVDPAELESLKEKLASLESERDEAVAARSDLQLQVDAIPEQVEAAKSDLRTRIGEQFKTRSKELTNRIKEKQAEVDSALAEKSTLQSELDSVKEELTKAQTHATGSNDRVNGVADTEMGNQSATGGGDEESHTRIVQLETRVAELESSIAQKDQELTSMQSQQDEKFKAKETELKGILNKRLGEVKQEAQKAKENALSELRTELQEAHQKEIDALRSQNNSTQVQDTAQAENGSTEVQTPVQGTEISESTLQNLTEAQARFLVQKNDTVRNILRTNIRKAVDKEKEALRKELTEAQGTEAGNGSSEQIQALEQKFAAEKENIIQEKEAEFAAEKESMTKDFETKLATEKQALIIDHQEKLAAQTLEFSQEAERKIKEQIKNAEALAEKRGTVKLNMAQNTARQANAKLDIVRKAAEETPQKPVIEVWNVAKDTKATAPVQQPKPAAAPTATPPTTTTAAAASTAAPSASVPQPESQPTTTETKAPVEAPAEVPKQEVDAQPSAESTNTTSAAKPTQQNAGTGPAALRQLTSGLPRGASSLRGRGGAQAAQSAQSNQSGQQQTGAGRGGTGIPRGRGGRGLSRGGGHVQTGIPHPGAGRGAAGAQSPSRGNLNPQASQFVPGGKRAREDGEGGEGGNIGKRIRGGGAGS